jgi:hypothetical protein
MLYDISPQDFAHHVRHANSWNDLGVRCGLEKDKYGNIRNDKLLKIQEKVANMQLDIDHFYGQKSPISDDVFKTIVATSYSVHQIMGKCKTENGRSHGKITKRIADLDIDISHFKKIKKQTKYRSDCRLDAIDDETFNTLVNDNTTLRNLSIACGYSGDGGVPPRKIVIRIEKLGLDTKHFKSEAIKGDKIFVVDSKYANRTEIKKRLQRDFDVPYECVACKNQNFTKSDDGVLMWNNKEIVLQLEHKNGIRNDNRLENLEFLCPSCHSQTSTFCGGNGKKYKTSQKWLEDGKTSYAPGSIASLLN